MPCSCMAHDGLVFVAKTQWPLSLGGINDGDHGKIAASSALTVVTGRRHLYSHSLFYSSSVAKHPRLSFLLLPLPPSLLSVFLYLFYKMLLSTLSLTVFLAVLFAVGSASSPSAHHGIARRHHHNRLNRDLSASKIGARDATKTNTTTATTGRRVRRSCLKKPSTPQSLSQSGAASTTKAAAPKPTNNTKVAPTPAKPLGNAAPAPASNNGKPSNWPTETQPGAAPSATRTSAADPFLLSMSKAYNNADNSLFTTVHTGQMTF